MKNRGSKSRFFVCFRPIEAESGGPRAVSAGHPKSSSRNRVITCIPVEGGDLIPEILAAEKADAAALAVRNRSKIAHRNLSQFLRSAIPESPPMKQDPSRPLIKSETSVPARIQSPSEIPDEKSVSETLRNSCSSSALSTEKRRGNYNPAILLYLFVVSFSVLVLWGRLCAIVCTSTWLYFVPRKVDETTKVPDGEKMGCKKKVVTEDLSCRHRKGSNHT